MAENDIYNNKEHYTRFKLNLKNFLQKPDEHNKVGKRTQKYYCKNPDNIKYFYKLFDKFEAKDISYVRRLKLLNSFKLICYATDKKLADCNREDIDKIIAFMHSVNNTSSSKYDFLNDIKFLWKIILPEKDEKGRYDEIIVPYVVRHIKAKQDISRQKRREDILSIDELEKLLNSFNQDKRLQSYLFISFETLARPQELLYTKIKDVELYDGYAKIWISEHGKEGTGFLQVIDSYPYLVNWLNEHPLKDDRNAFLFINLGVHGRFRQMRPENINKHIKEKLKLIKIPKRITCYSLKRSGVTFRRYRGDSDATIQHTARWNSTRQLKTYDYSRPEETFKIELIKRGILTEDKLSKDEKEKYKNLKATSKKCVFCNHINGLNVEVCDNCKRPLDREKIMKQAEETSTQMKQMQESLDLINKKMELIDRYERYIKKTKSRR